MTAREVPWDDFRLVRAIAQARTLAGAAAILGVNASTVFRRLAETEARLGVRLFERYRQGYELTSAGQEMARLAQRFDEDTSAFFLKHVGQNVAPAGEVRVTSTHSLVMHLLTPVFAAFRQVFSDIRLDLVLSNDTLNLSRRDADVAIRVTDAPPETLVGRRIASLGIAVYAARSLIEEHGGDVERVLAEAPCVALANDHPLHRAARYFRAPMEPDRIVYTIDNVLGLARAVEAGIGIGVVSCMIGDQSPEMVRLTPVEFEKAPGLWLLTHPELRQTPRVRVLMDFVGDALARKRALIEGQSVPNRAATAGARRSGKSQA
jgi:DNA-binding transcriptional LysR family regulator